VSDEKRNIRLDEDLENELEKSSVHKSRRKKSAQKRSSFLTRGRLVLFVLGLLVGGAVFAPQIVSHTSLGDWAISQFFPSKWGTLNVAKRNLSWWSPVWVRDVRLSAPDGTLMAQVGSLKTKETLWQIVSTAAISEIEIDRAAARVDWRSDGSNWEDFIFQLSEPSSEPSSTQVPEMVVNITNSEAMLESRTDNQRWLATGINGQIHVRNNANDIQIQTVASLVDANQNLPAGQCQATLTIGDQAALIQAMQTLKIPGQNSPAFNVSTAQGGIAFSAKLDQVAASLGRSIARRYMPDMQLSGLATGSVSGVSNWYGDFIQVATAKVSIDRLAFADPVYLAGDVFRQQMLDVSGGFEMNPAGLAFDQLKIKGDFGNSDFDGILNYDQLNNILATRRLPTQTLSTSGAINLAHLANQFPKTLQLRSDLVLEQGDLVWQVFNRQEGDGSLRLFVEATAKNIAGRSGNQSIRWSDPIQVSASIRDYNRPAMFDDLTINSNFLSASAKPQADGGAKINFQFDFDRLKSAIEQVFALPAMTMQGRGQGVAEWSLVQSAVGLPDINSKFSVYLANANLVFPGYFELRDPNLRLDAGAYFKFGNASAGEYGLISALLAQSDVTIENANLQLRTGAAAKNPDAASLNQDVASPPMGMLVSLKKPLSLTRLNRVFSTLAGGEIDPAQVSQTPVLEASVNIDGPLESWLEMTRPLLAGTDLAITGSCQTQATITLMDQYALLNNLNGKSQNFGFRGFGLILQEPTIQAAGAVSYHYANGLLHAGDLTLTGTTLAARAVKTKVMFGPTSTTLEGDVYFRGDLARLWHTINLMQVATAVDENTSLGSTTKPLQNLPKLATQPSFDSIALVNYNQPIEPTLANPAVSNNEMLLGGELVGMIHFAPGDNQASTITLDSVINNAWVGAMQPNGQLAAWAKEAQIKVVGNAAMSADMNLVNVPKLTIASQRINAAFAGTLSQLATQPQVQINGNANAAIVDWVRPMAGEALADLSVNGLTQHRFEVSGPMEIEKLSGKWITNWQAIQWMGLTGGPADIVLNMSRGLIQMQPLQFDAGGGQVNLAPEVDLRGETIWVRMPKGIVFNQVKLTPQLCRNWLKYAAPLLAEVTSVQGTFSIDSDGIEVPISDWTNMVAKARVTINGARVGPGPLGIQFGQLISTVKTIADGGSIDAAALNASGLGGLSNLAQSGGGQRTQALENLAGTVLGALGNGGNGQQNSLKDLVVGTSNRLDETTADAATNAVAASSEKTWLDIPQQTIGLNFENGSIVHDHLKMSIKGFDLVTAGKVGLDQSIAVNAVLSIPDDVLQKNPQLANAFGRSLQLPISGTLTKPSIQSTQLRTALNTAVSNSIQKAVGDQLEKKLGVPGLGSLGSGGSGDPLNGLLQQGQQKISDQLNKKLSLPDGSNPLQGILPSGNTPGGPASGLPQFPGLPASGLPNLGIPSSNGSQNTSGQTGTPPAVDPVNQLLNKGLDKGFKKLFGNGN